jgi:hypothetical protein
MSSSREKFSENLTTLSLSGEGVDNLYLANYNNSDNSKQLTKGQLSKNSVSRNVSRLIKPNIINSLSVNTQFVGESMRHAIAENQRVFVRSDMGTGKTYGMADAITDALPKGVVIVVTHLTSLVKGNEERLTLLLRTRGVSARIAHYSDDNAVDVADAQLIFTTLHSLHSVIDRIGGAGRVSLVMFDESESVAQIMTADIMDKSRERVANALDELSASGCKLVMLDAHLGNSTYAFCNAYLSGDWVMLDNKYQRWAGNDYQWIKSDSKNAEKAGIAKAAELLKADKKVFITSGSKSQAIRIYNTLKKMGLLENLKVLKAWNDGGSPELQSCKDNHDLFNDYDLVIATPSVGTGISIEPRNGEPKFDCVVSFIVRHKSTPDAVSAMQMPFRVRKTRENKIWLVECDHAPDSVNGLPEFVIQRDVKKQIELVTNLIDQYKDAIENPAVRNLIFSTYAGFAGAIALHKSDLWGNYWGTINAEFERKGIARDSDILAVDDDDIKDADKAARVEAKENALLELFEANDLHQEQAAAIEVKARFGNAVSSADKLALEKYKLVSNYADDDYNPLDLKAFKGLKAMQKRGYMAGCNRIANAHLALIDINKIVKAWTVTGNRQKDATSMDALKIKIEWKLDRILCDVVGISQTDDGYQITAKTIQSSHLTTKEKGHAVTRLLSEVIDNWNATHTEQRLNRKLLQEDALTFVAKLLSSRLKLNVKVKDDFIDIADNQPAVNLLTKHSKRGAVGLAKLVQAIDTDQANEPEEEQPKKKDAVAMLKQAWLDADKPCNFDDVLAMFLPDRQYIEDENGYSVAALVMGIRANFGAGNLRVA